MVREPFHSKYSSIDLTAGVLGEREQLTIESNMPFNGVIFSDGIEADFIKFNSGAIATIGIADEKAKIITG